jgi:hypothetical protein
MITAKGLSLLLLADTTNSRLDSPAFVNYRAVYPAKHPNRQQPTSLFYVQEPIPKKESTESEGTEKAVDTNTKSGDSTEGNEVWMQATRTLGSLFLHQEDASRDRQLDKTVDDTSPFPFHESTLSAYLLNLKRQEEVNREKSSQMIEQQENKEENEVGRLSNEFQIDQVSIFIYWALLHLGLLLISSCICTPARCSD